MNPTFTPSFGRRASGQAAVAELPPRPNPTPAKPAPVHVAEPNSSASGLSSASIAELRAVCLARLEPSAVASMAPERLTTDVERLISEIATERRIQLNGREQRALAGELVNDILGLGPLETLLEDQSISDIMVNGPEKTFVERGGKVSLANIRFRDTVHLQNICQRIAAAVGPARR